MESPRSLSEVVTDSARLDALQEADLLDTPVEEAFDRFTRMASRILHCPVSLVTLIDKDRQFFKSQVGVPEPVATLRETPLSHSFCQHVVRLAEPLVIEDARVHPLVQDNPVIKDLGVVAYLGMPLTTDGGHTLGSLCAIDMKPHVWGQDAIQILRDLAAMLMAEIALRQTAKKQLETYLELRHTEMERDELASMLVHDLRNPLGSMLSALEMVESSVLDETQRLCLDIAQRSGQRLIQMVGEILDVSKAEAGKMDLHLTEVAPRELIQIALDQLVYSAERSGVVLVTEFAPFLPMVRADAEKLRRVLVNLIANSIQHSPRGKVVISVQPSEEEDGLLFKVQDNGYGIPLEAQARIFDKFGAIDARKSGRVSAGLGLAFCKKVVEAHHGQITVASVLNLGTTFSFTIPTQRDAAPAATNSTLVTAA